VLGATAAALALGPSAVTHAGDSGRERLAYEIVMSHPGDRIQGWGAHRSGKMVLRFHWGREARSDELWRFLPMGPCPRPFQPCGFVEGRMNAAWSIT
jgi:hypothetical protein